MSLLDAGDTLVTLGRVSIASVFLMAGLTKILAGNLAESIQKYGLLPPFLVRPLARLLPWLELALAVLLFSGIAVQVALIGVVTLLASFMLVTIMSIRRGLSLHCDCFGLLFRERVGRATLIRDLVLFAVALAVLAFDEPTFTMVELVNDSTEPSSLGWAAITISMFIVSVWLAHKARSQTTASARHEFQSVW